MMIISPVLRQLLLASTEAHDEVHLRESMRDLIISIWILIPYNPVLTPRLRSLVPAQGDKLKLHDAEDVVEALEAVAGDGDVELSEQLVALRLVIARLGGMISTIRVGRLIIEELRSKAQSNGQTLP